MARAFLKATGFLIVILRVTDRPLAFTHIYMTDLAFHSFLQIQGRPSADGRFLRLRSLLLAKSR